MKKIILPLFVLFLLLQNSVIGYCQDEAITNDFNYSGITNNSMCVDGDYAYIASGRTGFTILDISDPRNIEVKSTTSVNKTVTLISKYSNFLVVGMQDNDAPIMVYDVTDVTNPSKVDEAGVGTLPRGMYAEGNNVYVTNAASWSSNAGVRHFKIGNDGKLQGQAGFTVQKDLRAGLGVFGGVIYASTQAGEINIYNGTAYTYDVGTGAGVTDFYQKDNYLFAVSGNYVKVLDVSDKSNISEVKSLDFGASVSAIDAYGDLAFIAGGGKIFSLNISDPKNPIIIDEQNNINAKQLVFANDKLFYSNGGDISACVLNDNIFCPVFLNADGGEITELENGEITVGAKFINTEDKEENIHIIICSYKNNELENVLFKPVTIGKGVSSNAEMKVDIDDKNNSEIKILIWKDKSDIRSLIDAVALLP